MNILLNLVFFSLFALNSVVAENTIKVGIPSSLTGDLAVMGDNLKKTALTYQKRYLRHPIEFIFEDAKKTGIDGLTAYKKLTEVDHVNMLIGGTVSNGTLAGAPLINKSKTVMITPLTGGSNIDKAGEFIFRIGNSDILNAHEQAEVFFKKKLKRIALFTEQTEYTQDMATHFREYFKNKGGVIVFDEDFLPDLPSFKSTIVKMLAKKPEAIFISTQSGLAFGIFVKELKQLSPHNLTEVHTNFVAAINPDAFTAAGEAIYGAKYLAPSYDKQNPDLIKFFAEFKTDHRTDPAIAMHTAGMVDALNMLQDFLDTKPKDNIFDSQEFHDYLLAKIKNYQGLMGTYSFDKEGNSDMGFTEAEIKKNN